MTQKWTADDIGDLGGHVAVVTGANSGLGLRTSLELVRHGAHVVMACRDETRGLEAVEQVQREVPDSSVVLGLLDLSDLASVRDLAGRVAEEHRDGIDLLVNNAGVMATPQRRTADGFELQLGTNHLGHFALTGLFLPSLLQRSRPRVVTVSSAAHKSGRIAFDDLMGDNGYRAWTAYGQSKLANLLFTFELDRRARAAGTDLVAAAAHPGYASTNLQTAGPRMSGSRVGEALAGVGNAILGQSDAKGALPQLYAATMPDVHGGDYFGPDGIAEWRGHPKRVPASSAAQDRDTARRLWEESERLTGVRYELLERAVGEA